MKLFILTIFSLYCFVQAEYDESLAMKLVYFAAASFIGPQDSNGDSLTNECFTKAYPNTTWVTSYRYTIGGCSNFKDSCQGLITSNADRKIVVFAFRGTVGITQLYHEAVDSDLVNYSVDETGTPILLGKVDNYFLGAMQSVWDTVNSHITEYNNKNYTFYFTGHSLGGAMAALTALRIVSQNLIPQKRLFLYTYGEPRIGDYQLAQNFHQMMSENKYRLVHYRDPVPHLPFCKSGSANSCIKQPGKAYHHPEEVWYNNTNQKMDPGNYVRCSKDDGEDNSCSDSISDWNFILDGVDTKGSDFHNNYFNHRLDKWGPAGCNSAGFVSFSFLFVLFSFFIVH